MGVVEPGEKKVI